MAYDATYCGITGHFATCCRTRAGTNRVEFHTGATHVATINKGYWTRAPRVTVGVKNLLGRRLGSVEALLDSGADMPIVDWTFMRKLGLTNKDLKSPTTNAIRGATQKAFKQMVHIEVSLEYAGIEVQGIVQRGIAVPLLIRWNGSAAL